MSTIENDGARLHYEVSGKPGGTLLVLVNGLGSNLHMVDKVLPAFQARHRVLRFDMRGHGESSVSPEPLTIDRLGSDVLRLLDEVQTDRASVCGLSLGGVVTLWLGIHAPGAFAAVDLCQHRGAHRKRGNVGAEDRDGSRHWHVGAGGRNA